MNFNLNVNNELLMNTSKTLQQLLSLEESNKMCCLLGYADAKNVQTALSLWLVDHHFESCLSNLENVNELANKLHRYLVIAQIDNNGQWFGG